MHLLFIPFFLAPDTSALPQMTEIKNIEVKADFFTTDNLGNCYVVKKDQITKYYPNGDSVATQSFKWLGTITAIDAANSLRLILFYRDLNQFVVLDNTLSMQGEPIKLENAGLQFATLLCQSPNNQNFWIYETEEFRLLRLDRNFIIINNSGNLTQIVDEDLNPDFMQECNNHLYLNNPEKGILVFDMFATYYKTIPLLHLHYFQVIDNDIFYLQEGQLYKYSDLDHISLPIPLNIADIRQFRIEKDKLFLLCGNRLRIFSIR